MVLDVEPCVGELATFRKRLFSAVQRGHCKVIGLNEAALCSCNMLCMSGAPIRPAAREAPPAVMEREAKHALVVHVQLVSRWKPSAGPWQEH